ncbi:hypothetical protein ASG89_11870 [Paenibacillus sp. Soil766]|uniref:O-antigen ligase family protein n=1 Tax=Paenibacillus sp. Soil766 TaxID=1736404 RepID=UPI00070EED8E|nr:O-antigen ligase family protein [Paenibacillus sp. Soil766]KRE83810.1 hypothetical protein ASG89_11870 [Paenibacillus sp. Soil766]
MNEIIKTNSKKQSITTFLYSIALLFMFTNNHNALMIADYYQIFLLAIVATLLSILARKQKIILSFNHIVIISFAMNFILVNLLTSLEIDRGYFLSYLLYICLYFVLTLKKYNSNDIYKFITAYIHSAVILALMIIIIRHTYGMDTSFRYTIKFSNNEAIDPNYLAAYIIVPALFSLKRWLMPVDRNKKFYYAITTLVICFGTLLTGSRAALIALVVGILCVMYYYLIKFKKVTEKTILKIYASLIVLFFICIISLFALPNVVESRLFESSYNDGSNKLRFAHWIASLESIGKNPLFGYGSVETKNILMSSVHHYGDVHNTVLSFWLQTGLVGLTCMIILHIRIWSLLKSGFILKSILICNVITALIISCQLTIGFWTLLILLEMIVQVQKENKIQVIDLI